MKRASSRFLIGIGRERLMPIMRQLLLCVLIPMGIAFIMGCDKDMGDLSRETLLIHSLTPESEDNLQVNQTVILEAKVYYSSDVEDLIYNWSVIDDAATMVSPESGTVNTNPSSVMDNAIHSKGTMVSLKSRKTDRHSGNGAIQKSSPMIPTKSGKRGMNLYETYNMVARATYVAPKNKGTYIIEFKVGNGALTVLDKVAVEVVDDR